MDVVVDICFRKAPSVAHIYVVHQEPEARLIVAEGISFQRCKHRNVIESYITHVRCNQVNITECN